MKELPLLEELATPFAVHTPCRHCVFASWEGKTQVGCQLSRLARLAEQGAVLEAYDDDSEFYVVNGRLCHAYRDSRSDWAREHAGHAVEQVKKELQLRLSALVLLDGQLDEEAVLATAGSLARQELPPVEALFIDNQDSIRPGRLSALLWQAVGNKLTWRIQKIVERDDVGQRPGPGRAWDLAVSQLRQGNYYACFRAGFVVPEKFVLAIDQAINERLERFGLLRPYLEKGGNGLVVQLALHRHPLVGGNAGCLVGISGDEHDGELVPPVYLEGVLRKVEYLAQMSGQYNMVRNVEEVCPACA